MTALRLCLAFSLLATSPLAARPWILDEMKSYSPRLQASFETYRIPKQDDRVTREVESLVSAYVNPSRPDAPVQTLP